ncbi:MAG: hypothetical protein K5905_23190 [Roseibium sp.]|uniref:NAD(P)-binding domain-containing protein n=1 Tax=Roseibium sp. TaxID=1936156 RepID=UPI0026312340|nr:NAD(P)-binding domain-containing protein [Roseibium sp.]MCV0428373.1 hypothetical protein [Roseibium sp.]
MKVGFIGLGTMGGNAAKNIIRAGFETHVHDLRREAARDHLAMGACWSASPKEMVDKVDCVVSMVFGPPIWRRSFLVRKVSSRGIVPVRSGLI